MPNVPIKAVLGLLGWAVIWGPIAGLVYWDAASDGQVSATAWVVVVFLFGVFRFVVDKATDLISFTRS